MSTITQRQRKFSSVLVIVMMIITLAACGFAGYAFWKMRHTSMTPRNTTVAASKAPLSRPLFYALDPFTLTLTDSEQQSERVLYIGFTLRLSDEETERRLEEYLPEVRSRLLLLLSHQQQAVLQTEQGKSDLVEQIQQTLKHPFASGLPEQHIADVLFTTFIMR